MKTIQPVTITIILLLISAPIFSQIKIDSVGDVSIGQVIYTKKHSNDSISLQIQSSNWDGGFIIDNSGIYEISTLRPNTPNYGILGTSSYPIGSASISNIYSGTYRNTIDTSKIVKKTNIVNASNKLSALQPLLYSIDSSAYKLEIVNDTSSIQNKLSTKKNIKSNNLYSDSLIAINANQYGINPEELQKAFPELVNANLKSTEVSINYIGLIPIIIAALNEQKKTIEKQEKTIIELEKKIKKLEK